MREFFGRASGMDKKTESHNPPKTAADRLTDLAQYQARLLDAITAKNGIWKTDYGNLLWDKKYMREWDSNRADYNPYVASGSQSSNLYGFIRARGLVPTGELLQKTNIVPFSGELNRGLSKNGINQSALSFSASVRVALEYAQKYSKSWSLKTSKERQQLIDESFNQLDDAIKEKFSTDDFSSNDQKKDFEKRRQEIWHTLSEVEQSFISEPFPVVYGIVEQNTLQPQPEDSFKHIPGLSDSRFEEHIWEGKLSADQFSTNNQHGRLVVYVPELYSKKVTDYFKKNNITIHVRTLETLAVANQQRTIEDMLHNKAYGYIISLLQQEWDDFDKSWGTNQNDKFDILHLAPVLKQYFISGDWRKGDEAIDHALHIWQKTGIIKSSLPEKQVGLLRDLIKKCFANFSNLP